jgi:hypothetical protein
VIIKCATMKYTILDIQITNIEALKLPFITKAIKRKSMVVESNKAYIEFAYK